MIFSSQRQYACFLPDWCCRIMCAGVCLWGCVTNLLCNCEWPSNDTPLLHLPHLQWYITDVPPCCLTSPFYIVFLEKVTGSGIYLNIPGMQKFIGYTLVLADICFVVFYQSAIWHSLVAVCFICWRLGYLCSGWDNSSSHLQLCERSHRWHSNITKEITQTLKGHNLTDNGLAQNALIYGVWMIDLFGCLGLQLRFVILPWLHRSPL